MRYGSCVSGNRERGGACSEGFSNKIALALFRIKDKRDIGNNYEPAAAQVISDWQAFFLATYGRVLELICRPT